MAVRSSIVLIQVQGFKAYATHQVAQAVVVQQRRRLGGLRPGAVLQVAGHGRDVDSHIQVIAVPERSRCIHVISNGEPRKALCTLGLADCARCTRHGAQGSCAARHSCTARSSRCAHPGASWTVYTRVAVSDRATGTPAHPGSWPEWWPPPAPANRQRCDVTAHV